MVKPSEAEPKEAIHPSINQGITVAVQKHTQLPSQSFALCVPFYRQERVLSDSTILEPGRITGA